ncbi:protein THEM6-like isoform X1 [Salvelinus fontinalis]|uniref:protein THEM6-like isoform X1 n=1 Tax=Salvelinus fontinalis TaxID=8038 RepID=UPI002486A97A|nr:protein THEM6-like isoform X1 [Salvelinus fontinalis]
MLLCALGGLLLLFSCLDVWYFLRGVVVVVQAWFQPPVWDVLAEQSVAGRVLPHDLDYMGHMNNGRYLRECDFARFHYYMRNGIFKALRTLKATMVVGASTIRYRRSLAFGEAFDLRTRIVAWDDKSFFVEQRFVSQGDGFISAVMLCRQNVLRSNPESILQLLCKRKVECPDSVLFSLCVQVECPDYPEDLQHWISFISASSQALRAQSGLEDKTGAQEDKDK